MDCRYGCSHFVRLVALLVQPCRPILRPGLTEAKGEVEAGALGEGGVGLRECRCRDCGDGEASKT